MDRLFGKASNIWLVTLCYSDEALLNLPLLLLTNNVYDRAVEMENDHVYSDCEYVTENHSFRGRQSDNLKTSKVKLVKKENRDSELWEEPDNEVLKAPRRVTATLKLDFVKSCVSVPLCRFNALGLGN